MPTQEEISAANTELQIANDNYAKLADRYNKYQDLFKRYAAASPEVQERASEAMNAGLKDYENLRLQMYAAQDRVSQAQNRVSNYGNIVQQPTQQTYTGGQTRRVIPTTTTTVNEVPVTEQPTTTSTGYQIQAPIRTQRSINAYKGTSGPFTMPYQNNTLSGIAGNLAAQSKYDWNQAGNEWSNTVLPRIKKYGGNFLNAEKAFFYDNPNRYANTVKNFVLGAPQKKL